MCKNQLVTDRLARVGYISENQAMQIVGGETPRMYLRQRAGIRYAKLCDKHDPESDVTFMAWRYVAALGVVAKRQRIRERRVTTLRHKRRTIANLQRGRIESNRPAR